MFNERLTGGESPICQFLWGAKTPTLADFNVIQGRQNWEKRCTVNSCESEGADCGTSTGSGADLTGLANGPVWAEGNGASKGDF